MESPPHEAQMVGGGWTRDEPDGTGDLDTLSVGNCLDATGHTDHDGYCVTGVSFTAGSCQPVSNPGSVLFSDPATLCCR